MRRAIAERLAETEPVVIVGQPVSLVRDRAFLTLRGRCIPFGRDANSWYYRPMHFPEKLPAMGRIFKALNEKWIQREIDKLLPLQMNRIVCYDSPTQYRLVKKFRERLSVYLAVDDRALTVWGYPISGEAEAESRLLGKVDRVICVSEQLAQTLKSRAPKGTNPSIMVLPNAYNERIFDPHKDYQEPAPLRNIPRARILISGHVSERIDWDGIAVASRLRPEWTWVFLGPADNGMREKIKDILGNQGFYHPAVPANEVPAWIFHCDACAVAYRLNPFTQASHPLKAIEYLAMGAPVLSTRIPSLGKYDGAVDWVSVSEGKSYVSAMDKNIYDLGNSEFRTMRQRAVAADSWEVRLDQFKEIVNNDAL